MPPLDALKRLTELTFDNHLDNEAYIHLVMNENIQRGQYLAQSESIRELNVPVINSLKRLYERGVTSGVFRPGLDPIDTHASISALTFFNVSNQHTLGLIFKNAGQSKKAQSTRRQDIVELIARFVCV